MTPAGRLACVGGAVLVLASLLFQIGGYPLLDPDEGRNAEVEREMASTGNYLLPRLDGLPYVDKPVLYFAAGALSIRVFGPNAAAARLPSLLFTLGTLALVWWLGRRLFDEPAGWIATLATASSPLVLAFARTVIFDSALALVVTAAVTAFYFAGEAMVESSQPPAVQPSSRPLPRTGEWLPALAWAAMAVGVLTKGPIALALPLLIAIPYLVWRRAWRPLVDPVGILLFLAIVLPWVRYMSDHVPGYLRYVLATETFGRLTTPELQRTGPWWYFMPILLLGALPWSIMALGSPRWRGGPMDRRRIFLLLWIVVPLAFFSLSQSKRPQYVLPLVPAIALLAASSWSQRSARLAGGALGLIGLIVLLFYGPIVSRLHGVQAGVANAVPSVAIPLGVLATLGGATALAWNRRRATIALALPALAIPFAGTPLLRVIGTQRSAAGIAAMIEPALESQTEVVGIGTYPPSLPFYLRRTITIATDDAAELTSNYIMRHPDVWKNSPGSPIRPANWWREASVECDRPRVFVIRVENREARDFLTPRLALLGENGRYAAFGPCGTSGLAARGRAGTAFPSPAGEREQG